MYGKKCMNGKMETRIRFTVSLQYILKDTQENRYHKMIANAPRLHLAKNPIFNSHFKKSPTPD